MSSRPAILPSVGLLLGAIWEMSAECVVATCGEECVDKGERSSYYFRARPEMLETLLRGGVDLVTTANNHSGYYGPAALVEQAGWLDMDGIGHAGAGRNREEAFRRAIRRAGHLDIALFALDAAQQSFAAGESSPGTAWLDPAKPAEWGALMAPRIAAAREQADIVLVAIHWGRNNLDQPDALEIAGGHALIDAGADAVLGASAHLLQGVEVYRDRPILHDAGDLLFDALTRGDNDSGIFTLEIDHRSVSRVAFLPLEVGFCRTVPLAQPVAAEAVQKFAGKCAALGTRMEIGEDRRGHLELTPPDRSAGPSRSQAGPVARRIPPPLGKPRPEWLADDAGRVDGAHYPRVEVLLSNFHRISANGARQTQQPPACGIIISSGPDHAERQDFACKLPIGNPGKLRDSRGLARQREAATYGNQGQDVVASDLLGVNLRMAAEVCKMCNQVVVDFLTWSDIAHDEPLRHQVRPSEFDLVCQGMTVGQHDEDPLAPQMLGLTAVPDLRTCYKGDVEIQSPDGSDMLWRVSLDEIDPDIRMELAELPQQVEQESGRKRRKDPNPDMALLGPTNRGNTTGACVDMPERLSRRPQKPLARKRQANTARVALKQGRTKFIFHVPNAAADRRFLDIECSARLAEAAVLCRRHEITEVLELDAAARQLRYPDFTWSIVARTQADIFRPVHDHRFPFARGLRPTPSTDQDGRPLPSKPLDAPAARISLRRVAIFRPRKKLNNIQLAVSCKLTLPTSMENESH